MEIFASKILNIVRNPEGSYGISKILAFSQLMYILIWRLLEMFENRNSFAFYPHHKTSKYYQYIYTITTGASRNLFRIIWVTIVCRSTQMIIRCLKYRLHTLATMKWHTGYTSRQTCLRVYFSHLIPTWFYVVCDMA